MRFFRCRVRLPALRNQTTDKNFTRVDLPIEKRNLAKRTGFQPGEKPAYAVHDVFTYPQNYKPWTLNYTGNGLFYGMLAIMTFSYVMYERDYLLRTGRVRRPEKLYYRP